MIFLIAFQGMNEIIAPIYYIFANDPDASWREHAEADAFFCFTNIMSEIMNNFCKTLDASEVGIKGQIKELNGLLKKKDPQLWLHLVGLSENLSHPFRKNYIWIHSFTVLDG